MSEYTFHYWIWKNYINNLSENWIGFCQYRKFWTIENYENKNLSLKILPSIVLQNIPNNFQNYEVILGEPFFINQKSDEVFKKRFQTFC